VSEVARIAGPVGAVGLALLILGTRRDARLVGLAAWAAGMLGLAAYLAPSSSHTRLAAGAIGLVVVAALGAWLLVRTPWLLPFAVVACVPARIPVSIGGQDARLLVPLYAVVAALGLALGWELLREGDRGREFGPLGVPLAAFLVWTGLTLTWTNDLRRGAIFMACFVLPFALLALGLARLPWRGRWFLWLWGVLAGTALLYAAIGAYQWATRDIFWNNGLSVGNTYAAFFRVNSVFWDPSIYGRYLVVGILVTLPALLLKTNLSGRQAAALVALIAVTWSGLFLSFSQSSFVALGIGVLVAAAPALGQRTVAALVAMALAAGVAAFSFGGVRHDLVNHSRSGINQVTRGRAKLVSQGTRIALAHPVVGVGLGGFKKAYAKRVGFTGLKLKGAASHTTPVTVAAEEGLVGLALFAWLLGAGFVATLRRPGYGFTSRVSFAIGLVLVAIAVHSLFYNAFFEDPMMWAALGLVGVAARAPRKPAAAGGIAVGGDHQPRQHEAGERVGEVRRLEDSAEEEQHEHGDRVADRAGPDGARAELVPDEEAGERQPDRDDERKERVGAVAIGEDVRAEQQGGQAVPDDAVGPRAVAHRVAPDGTRIGDQKRQEADDEDGRAGRDRS
jgi:putative inorganic carbon (hco3(-)) transporter